jgi:hypothetical protein
MMAGGEGTVKRCIMSVMRRNYLRILEVNDWVGRPCMKNGRNENSKEATGEEVESRRIPDRPRTKWLEKENKDDGSRGIGQCQPHWIAMNVGDCSWRVDVSAKDDGVVGLQDSTSVSVDDIFTLRGFAV